MEAAGTEGKIIVRPVFYFVLMSLFILEGWLLSSIIPFQKAMSREESRTGHVGALDGLRGILAIGVCFVHALGYFYYAKTNVWEYPPSNFYSQLAIFPVTMFFFITGYLFWSKLERTPNIPALQFYYRRLGRLGPAYGFACGLFFLLVAIASGFHRNESFHKLFVEGMLWLFFLSTNHDVNAIINSKDWLGQVWTLRYEWIFYLMLPFLGWFARKRLGLLALLTIAAIVYIASNVIHLHGAAGKLEDIFGAYLFYLLFVFSVGMFVAGLKPTQTWVRNMRSSPATVLSLGLIGVVLVFMKSEYGWLESLALAVPFAFVCFGNDWFGLLTSHPMRFLGRISYSIYLLHLTFLTAGFMVTRRFFDITSYGAIIYWTFVFICIGLTILVSAFSYQYLEHPFLNLGKSKTRPIEKLAV